MKLLAVLVCGSIPLLAFGAASSSTSSARKCVNVPILFPDAPEPVFVLNGEAVDRDSVASTTSVTPDKILSVELACADKIYERFRIKARRTGLIVFTRELHTELKSAMDSIAVLQVAFLERTGGFASTVAELGWSSKSGRVTVEMRLLDDGSRWTATGNSKYLQNEPLTVSGQRKP